MQHAENDEIQEDTNEAYEFIDFTIRLTDTNGAFLEFPISRFSPVQPTLKRKFTKLSSMQNPAESEIILQYFYFPLEQFAEDYPDFDFENIISLRFVFDLAQEGVVTMNNIGFILMSPLSGKQVLNRH